MPTQVCIASGHAIPSAYRGLGKPTAQVEGATLEYIVFTLAHFGEEILLLMRESKLVVA